MSNPDYVFYTNLLAIVFKGTPYEHDALGSRPSFDKTTGAMLGEFHNAWYVPNNAILVIVGDIPLQETLDKVKTIFSPLPQRDLPQKPDFHFQTVASRTIKMDTDSATGTAAIAFRFPGFNSSDFAAVSGSLSDVLGSQRARLYALVPQGKALAASFSYDTLPRSGLGYAIANFAAGQDANALLNQMRAALAAEITNGIIRGFGGGRQASRGGQPGICQELRFWFGHGVVAGCSRLKAVNLPRTTSPPSASSRLRMSTASPTNCSTLITPSPLFSLPVHPASPSPTNRLAARNPSPFPKRPPRRCPTGRRKFCSIWKFRLPRSIPKSRLFTNGLRLIVQPGIDQ